jgi:hypothetical protein
MLPPQLESYSREFNDIAKANKGNIFGQLRSATIEVTSLSMDSKTAPNTTLLNYDRRALDIVNSTSIDMILYVPLVEANKKSEYESYAVQSQGWIAQDYVSLFVCRKNIAIYEDANSHHA